MIDHVRESDFAEIVDVWEASVRATHHFIIEEDIRFYKSLITYKYLKQAGLLCWRENGRISGFLGINADYVDMLFIHPESRGKGIGKKLLLHAINELKARKVDVNEQNEQAIGFYEKFGFKTARRSELDGMGMPYPLLHMEILNS